ncbi:MAG: hypothetical protein ACXWAT_00120 [Methylobacter sp.]
MNFLNVLLAISPALEAGKTINNAAGWANVSTATHALIAVFGFLLLTAKVFGYDIPLSDDQIAKLAGAIASVGGTAVGVLHVTTNPHVGITRK